jgi:hypothetical protein
VVQFAFEGPKWLTRTVTWSFATMNYAVDQGTPFSSAISDPAYQAIVRQDLALWGSYSGITFVQTPDQATTDIRIGFGALGSSGEIGNTFYRSSSYAMQPDVIVRIQDPAGDPLVGSPPTYKGFQTTFAQVVLHEIGHAIGLAHQTDPASIMYPVLSTANPALDANDIASVETLYQGEDRDFDAVYYLAHNPDVAAAGIDPLTHWVEAGWHEGRDPNALFGVQYYLNQNPDVAAAGVDPLQHYETLGWKEGRNPSLDFNTNAYLAANPDVVAQDIDPLWFQLNVGQAQGRMTFLATPNAIGPQDMLVVNAFYWQQNPDVAAAGVDPSMHYDGSGWHEGRNPDPFFDTKYYLAHNPDVAAAGIDPLYHYEIAGWREGRDPSAAFSTNKYLAANPDVAAAGQDPLQHYLLAGEAEGRAIYQV